MKYSEVACKLVQLETDDKAGCEGSEGHTSALNSGFALQLHMAEHPAGHLVLKWLIEQDVTLAEAGKEGTNAAL